MAVTYTVTRKDNVAFSGTLTAANDGDVLANGVKQQNGLECQYRLLPALTSVTGTAPNALGIVRCALDCP